MRKLKVFRCAICGNIVTLLHEGGGELVCCGQPMNLLTAGENDTAAKEKHVPVFSVIGDSVTVDVGNVPHPMTEEHYIQFVILVTDTGVFTEFLQPGQAPKAFFTVPEGETFEVFEYCNLHGLWKA
jgi:superoxide reductase